MTDQRDEQRERKRRQRARQFEIERITFQYTEEYRQGQRPRIEDYVRRYPQYASELLEFAVYFHTVGFEDDSFEEPGELALSPAAEKALARIRERRAAYAPSPAIAPIDSLFKQGLAVQLAPPQVAAAVGLTMDVLAKIEARAITVASIPRTLIQRLATALKLAPEAITAYLSAAQPGQVGGFYYADQAPTQQEESFLDAVQASALSPEQKSAWSEIVQAETNANP